MGLVISVVKIPTMLLNFDGFLLIYLLQLPPEDEMQDRGVFYRSEDHGVIDSWNMNNYYEEIVESQFVIFVKYA